MFRTVAAIALLLYVGNSFAAEVGRHENVFVSLLHGSPSPVSIGASPSNDITLTWADVGQDGSLDVFATVRSGYYFATPIKVNTTTAGDQQQPRLARSANGQSYVVWVAGEDIYGQQLAADLGRVGAEFLVSMGNGVHSDPAVAADAFGNFVVTWRRRRDDLTELVGRRFAPDSTAVGPVFVISTVTTAPTGAAAISMSPWGEFAVAWQHAGEAGDGVSVRASAANGFQLSEPISPGVAPALARRNPTVAMDARGGFVVAWTNADAAGSTAIQARQYLSGGTPVAPEFAVATVNVDSQSAPSAAVDVSGDFALSWDVAGLFGRQMFAQLFTDGGVRQGPEVNSGHGWLVSPAVSMDADGDTTVVGIRQWSEREIIAVTMVGPESIDAELTISESVDPVMIGNSVRYTITVANKHLASTATGIPDIDSAIGRLSDAVVPISHGGTVSYPGFCWRQSEPGSWRCPLGALDPGATRSFAFDVVPWEATAVGIHAHVDSQYFVDPDPGNSYDDETTSVVCAKGQGGFGSVRISRAPTTIDEGAAAVVEVERFGGSCGDVSVRGSWGPGELRWAAGEEGVRSTTIANLNPQDNIDEDPRTGRFWLYLPQGGLSLGEPWDVAFVLQDDDAEPTVSVTPTSIVRNEGDNNYSVDFLITLSHPSQRYPAVRFALGGTATRNNDFRLWSPTTEEVTFYGTYVSERVTLHLIRDSVTEQDETAVLTLVGAMNAVISSQSSGTLTIQDDDRPTISIVASDEILSEGMTSASVMIEFSKSASVPITVPLNWTGSATLGADFSAPTSVTIPAGTLHASLRIPILKDGLDEDQENAVLTLGQPSIGELGADTSYSISITDIDPTPTITFLETVQRGTEGESFTLSAELSAISGREVRVLLVRSGQAQIGSDYTMSSDAIVIPAGTKSSGPTLKVTDDTQIESPETATFTMGAMTNVTPGVQTLQAIVILDNDPTMGP